MSKIMRQIYAEARAAREAAANPGEHRIDDMSIPAPSPVASAGATIRWWALPVPNPAASARSTIQWWVDHYERAGEQLRLPSPPPGPRCHMSENGESDARACR